MVVMQPAWLAPFLLLTGCGGLVVFEDADAADGSGSSESPTDASGTGPATGSTGSSGGDGGSDAGSSSSSAGGAAPDGACIADDYCSCIAVPTCQVVGDECFCPCDEPCSEPCECDCAGGAFLGLARLVDTHTRHLVGRVANPPQGSYPAWTGRRSARL